MRYNSGSPSDEEKKQDPDSTRLLENLIGTSSRGEVDVSKLVALVTEGYNDPKETSNHDATPDTRSETDLWNEQNAQENNVHVARPSHDGWGIKKIVLVFSSDCLQDVFEFPWWHLREDMRDAVQPVLDCLQVQRNQIVRLLLAALPPGVTIPIHYDSGEWVKHSHRVHVPVIASDPSRILFRCGPSADELVRIDCTRGHVFEMNNQAEHAVSNCGLDHRVHLILDYVDAEKAAQLRRIQLDPGERLVQTRRSVDRWRDRGSRPTPSFIILGAQKAGTTSLYDYIGQHPLVVKAKRRETHCLDWRWNTKLRKVADQRAHCHQFYYEKELRAHPSCLTGDSTPSYLLDSKRVIPRLKRVFPHPVQFLVMMRDPVRRALSHYAMVTSPEGSPQQLKTRGMEWRQMSLEEVVRLDFNRMDDCGLIPYWDMNRSEMDMAKFRAFSGSKEEDAAWDVYLSKYVPINTGSYGLVTRGMYELQLRPWLQSFARNRFLCLKLEDLKKGRSTIERVWSHLGLPLHSVEDDSPKNRRSYEPMDTRLEVSLQRFYAPHNKRLGEVLGKWDNHWEENPWNYEATVPTNPSSRVC